jgi:hypothetical protein
MYNPRKVWLLYARELDILFRRNAVEIQELVRQNLVEVSSELGLKLPDDRRQALLDIATAFFEEEYLEAYRRAGAGEEPDETPTALQSCTIVEEGTGYPVTRLFKRMVNEIMTGRNRPEEAVVAALIEKFGAYPAQAILAIDLRNADVPENYLPDYCLAKSIKTIVDRHVKSGRR